MAIRNDTILAGLNQERDRLREALKPIDTKTLQAQLAAIEQAIAIYEPRVTADAQKRLPKTLKAASKIRNESSENSNGNGRRGPTTGRQQQIARMIAVLQNPEQAAGKSLAVYFNNGYLTRSAKGVYSITPKGKARLSELTHDASA